MGIDRHILDLCAGSVAMLSVTALGSSHGGYCCAWQRLRRDARSMQAEGRRSSAREAATAVQSCKSSRWWRVTCKLIVLHRAVHVACCLLLVVSITLALEVELAHIHTHCIHK
jgi:hypothetical protein